MNEKEILDLARANVPQQIQASARIVQLPARSSAIRLANAPAGPVEDDDLDAALARELGLPPPSVDAPETPDSADVEFSEQTARGAKSTVVQIRGGKIARILTRA